MPQNADLVRVKGMDFSDMTSRFIYRVIDPAYAESLFQLFCESLCDLDITSELAPFGVISCSRIVKIKTMEGSCNCGAITVQVNDSDLFTRRQGHTCRCINCRKTAGSGISPSFAFSHSHLIVHSLLAHYNFHNSSLRSFCQQPHN